MRFTALSLLFAAGALPMLASAKPLSVRITIDEVEVAKDNAPVSAKAIGECPKNGGGGGELPCLPYCISNPDILGQLPLPEDQVCWVKKEDDCYNVCLKQPQQSRGRMTKQTSKHEGPLRSFI